MAGDLRPAQRAPLFVLGFVGLVVGVGAGLARLGYAMPAMAAAASAWHGALMVGGFFGVVISLERAVAIGRYWAYLAPLASGLGSIALIVGAPAWAAWLLFAGSTVLLAASADVFRRQRAVFTLTLALGAACWTIGNLMWALGVAIHGVVAWWLAFLILTIGGERLELSRFLPPSPMARRAFVAILVAIFVGLAVAFHPLGVMLFAVGLLALSVWLLKQDIARRTVHREGLTRFIAVCLLSGYAWLAVGALTMLAGGLAPGTRTYDAAVHALALGFVFSMVFGHAPIIFPAVLRVAVPYHPVFYVPLVLLHGSLLVRIAGDAVNDFALMRIGGLLNAVALATFIVTMLSASLRGRNAQRRAVGRGRSQEGTDERASAAVPQTRSDQV
jgi:hypothetical protein